MSIGNSCICAIASPLFVPVLLDVGGGAAAAQVAEGEADVAQEGGDEAVVGGHDAEPLAQRLAEVGCGGAFREVVDHGVGHADVAA